MIGRGDTFNAAEAVSPGGMTPAEWNAIPGASGGEAPAGVWDWRKALAAGAGSIGTPQRGSIMPPMSTPSVSTGQVAPLNFDIVNEFLASLLKQAGAGSKGKR